MSASNNCVFASRTVLAQRHRVPQLEYAFTCLQVYKIPHIHRLIPLNFLKKTKWHKQLSIRHEIHYSIILTTQTSSKHLIISFWQSLRKVSYFYPVCLQFHLKKKKEMMKNNFLKYCKRCIYVFFFGHLRTRILLFED